MVKKKLIEDIFLPLIINVVTRISHLHHRAKPGLARCHQAKISTV